VRTRGCRRADKRKGFTEQEHARLLDAAHQKFGGPLELLWATGYPRQPDDARGIWSLLKRSIAHLTKRGITQLAG